MSFRIKLIQYLIELNERIVFYPRLKSFYKKHLKKSDAVIIDVGSNKGQFIDFITGISSSLKVFGFEPNPSLYNYLLSKYDGSKNIIVQNIGISDINGKLSFHENVMNETSSFEELNYNSNYLKKKAKILGVSTKTIINRSYDVPVEKLSDWINKNDIKNVELLKIDVEGHEYNCLLGLFSEPCAAIRFIQIESHQDDMYKYKKKSTLIAPLLLDNGFVEVYRIKHGFGDLYEIIFENTRL